MIPTSPDPNDLDRMERQLFRSLSGDEPSKQTRRVTAAAFGQTRPMLASRVTCVSFGAVLGVACSSSNPVATGAGGSAGAGGSRGMMGPGALVGTFAVRLQEAMGATRPKAVTVVGGKVYDGPAPDAIVLEVSRVDGACQLLRARIPFCAGGCGGTAVCAVEDTCVPYPKVQGVGIVRVEGLGADPVAMDPVPPSFTYESVPLPYPPCEEGSEVRLVADGFSASVRCVAPLVVSTTDVVVVRRGEPVKLAWVPPAKPDAGPIHIWLDVSHHGGKKGEIVCDVPDTGAFEIPASLVTPLVDLGLAGYPSVAITRRSSVAATGEPHVTFAVSAEVDRAVDTGIASCVEDADCAAGNTCDKMSSICR